MSELEKFWQSKANESILEAANEIQTYTNETAQIIRSEIKRRNLVEQEPAHPPYIKKCILPLPVQPQKNGNSTIGLICGKYSNYAILIQISLILIILISVACMEMFLRGFPTILFIISLIMLLLILLLQWLSIICMITSILIFIALITKKTDITNGKLLVKSIVLLIIAIIGLIPAYKMN